MRTIEDMLRSDRREILEEAARAVTGLEHYGRDGAQVTLRRLEALYGEVEAAVARRNLTGIVSHALTIARERWEHGFDYVELLSAFTALEAAIHRRTVEELPPDERALGLGLVGTAFAHARRSLGRAFSDLAAGAPALDLTPMFTGAYCDADGRAAGEAVHPV